MSIFPRFFTKPAPAAPAEMPEFNFKQRVEAFWTWFENAADRFYQTIEDKQCGSLATEVGNKIDELLPGMAWVFGPGEDRKGHSFTLSGEGILPKQLLAAYWLERAPAISGWTFHADRQPSDRIRDFELVFDKLSFRPIEFWVTPEIDEEKEKIDISVWHPLTDQVGKDPRHRALFLMLDDIFGEFGTCRWIGRMQFTPDKLGPSMPITELKDFVDAARAERGWKMHFPSTTWVSYSFRPEHRNPTQRRGDTIAGSSGCWRSFREFLNDRDGFKDPFHRFGAEWIYLAFPTTSLQKGREVDSREDMADVIEEALTATHSGRILGGASGSEQSYLDFLIYDGSRSLAIIRDAAKRAGLSADTRLEYLAASKRERGRPLFAAPSELEASESTAESS